MRVLAGLLVATAAFADVTEAVRTLEQRTAGLRAPLRQSLRLAGAASLRDRYPEISHRLAQSVAADGPLEPWSVARLAKLAPADRAFLFEKAVASFPFEKYTPQQASVLLTLIGVADQGPAADAADRLAHAAAKANDTVVLRSAAAQLKKLAPERYAALHLAEEPKAAQPVRRPATGTPDPLNEKMRQLRGNLSDAERSKLAIEIATAIGDLPAGVRKANLAAGLANLSTEGDLGTEALTAVVTTLARSLRETPEQEAPYVQLARMIRYEHLKVPDTGAEVAAADALLALQEELHRETGFTVVGLDGKQFSLAALRGKVVVLNFWATWCPPCRKEMPDLEKLHKEFAAKGLVILAVSDEDAPIVREYVEKQRYTFQIALDPERKTNVAFDVEGIPQTFVFDREGRLAAEAIDMRTERQFREMLRKAGLE